MTWLVEKKKKVLFISVRKQNRRVCCDCKSVLFHFSFLKRENMVSMMTALWQVIIPMIVLSHFSASLPSQERMERHADGLFHSELSKMNGNAYVQQLVKHLVGLKDRSLRHSDGLFTSEYSKMRGNAQVQKFIQNLMGRKRSRSDRDAREAAAITSQYLCPFSKQLVADMKEDTDGSE
ncbi:glucagon family neuropeptides-like isoform X3 [Anomalospiza imberbis]|uniref:glucagon family neuropeptides-like isoform X3 n=1 Tax=Anomalospiza imberbis TaxID=187417 RepID=UPI00358F16F3